ncbi:malate synthase A [Leucobacter albus]|uniref:malate synthase n=1 Tax=Leucobacter albus TaxID=272210 RepID=A0ABW3TP91_9MICO
MALTLTDSHPTPRAPEILTPEALEFVGELHERFAGRVPELLERREARRAALAARPKLDFDPETAAIRSADWRVPPPPPGLVDRRVEITGPATPAKMAVNALNSGAKVWLADLEDASTPTWANVIDALTNLTDAAHGRLRAVSHGGKEYRLRTDGQTAVVVVRPRGWHLPEAHVLIGSQPAVGALVDFGLHFFHNARTLAEQGLGPFYYLPKMENRFEARLWNEIFTFAEESFGLPESTIRATMLIETITAAFEMDEMLYELRPHAAGLNAGRWDYLFSIIKNFRDAGPAFELPDRAQVVMTAPFMRAYTELLVQTCHKRGAFAMGGMAAVIPNRREPEVTEQAFAKVRADKQREAGDGFDGSWVAHPDLVPVCEAVFDEALGERPNQIDRLRPEVAVTADDLLAISSFEGTATLEGLRNNLYVAVAYTAVWLSGNGAVAIHNMMEDAATAEISRSQVWQQLRNGTVLDSGESVTADLVADVLAEESDRLRGEVPAGAFEAFYVPAIKLIGEIVLSDEYVSFLTLPAYRELVGGTND